MKFPVLFNMTYLKRHLIPLVFLFLSLNSFAEVILGFEGEEATSVGIFIKDLQSGDIIFDHNSELALTPASVMKVVTTATALDILGKDYQFKTSVQLSGSRSGSTWNGNLIITSCGDPTLESEHFKSNLGFCNQIISALKQKSITKITGTVVVRQSLSDAGPILQWECEDIAWPYGAGLFGLNWRDNSFTIYPATGKTTPHVPNLNIEIRKATSNDLVRGVDSNNLIIYATNTDNRKWVTRSSMPDPSAVFQYELIEKIKAAGIEIGSKAVNSSGESLTLCTHTSPLSEEILRSLMVRSDNLFAEGILRAIAPGSSRKKAIEKEKELWNNRGISGKNTIINDGSGLTRANRLSPRFLGDILEYMAKSNNAELFSSFFPKAGKDGTMKSFLAKTPLDGAIALKTGSVSSVQTYAGYLFDSETGSPSHVVVVMVNGFFCPRAQVRKAVENLLLSTFAPAE